MFRLKIEISSSVEQSLYRYIKFPNEVGGGLFGIKEEKCIQIKAISMKQGEEARITFYDTDSRLFSPPEGLILLGTWHSHPFQDNPIPSIIDLTQWKIWQSEFLHLIIGERRLICCNSNGKIIKKAILTRREI